MTVGQKMIALSDQISKMSANSRKLLAAVGDGSLDLNQESLQTKIQTATELAIDDVLSVLEDAQVMDISKNVDVQQFYTTYANKLDPFAKFEFELFESRYTLSEFFKATGVKTITGDDSVDIDNTNGLIIGEDYVISSSVGNMEVTVKQILSEKRFTIKAPATASVTGGVLTKTNWTISDKKAVGDTGQVYFSKPINIDPAHPYGDQTRAIVIRQSKNAEPISLYFRKDNSAEWKKAEWAWVRDTRKGFTSTQYADDSMSDYEYIVPVSGDFTLKLVCNSDSTVVNFVIAMTLDTNIKGQHHPPNTPTIIAPVDGATDIPEQVVLMVNEELHPVYGSRIVKACFQISDTSGDFSSPIFDDDHESGISLSLPKGVLSKSTQYYLRARTMDETNTPSAWSNETSFTTAASFLTTDTPVCLAPAINSEILKADSLKLVSSAFSHSGDPDTHANSQWQVANDPLFDDIVHDSGSDDTNLTNYSVPDGTISRGGTYFWRVRHEGTSGGWSTWSASTLFSVREFVPFVMTMGDDDYLIFQACATDAEGYLYGAGVVTVVGTGVQALLVKLDHDGSVIWQKTIGGTHKENFIGMDIDSEGNIYTVGVEDTTHVNYDNCFIAKFNKNGNVQWRKSLGTSTNDCYFYDIAIDSNDNLYVSGFEEGDYGFILKLDTDGGITWQKKIGSGYYTRFYGVGIDSNDNIYLGGYDRPTNQSKNHAAIVKINPSGAIQWQKKLAGAEHNYFWGLTVDESDNVYAVGHGENDDVSWNGIIFKYDSNGTELYGKHYGGSGQDKLQNAIADKDGNLYVVGEQASDNALGYEATIVKLTPAGAITWQRSLAGSLDADYAYDVTISPDETIYMVGSYGLEMLKARGLVASLDANATGATGTLPNMTNLSWMTPSVSIGDSSDSSSNSSLTISNTSYSFNELTIEAENSNFVVTESSY